MDCKICFEFFNESDHKPTIITSCGHTYCSFCLGSKSVQNCPECRSIFNGTVVNYAVLNSINTNNNNNNNDYLKEIKSKKDFNKSQNKLKARFSFKSEKKLNEFQQMIKNIKDNINKQSELTIETK